MTGRLTAPGGGPGHERHLQKSQTTRRHFVVNCVARRPRYVGVTGLADRRVGATLEAGSARPSLIIGMPVGFVGAPESKDYLWDQRKALGVECITLQGRVGGSALAAGAFNTLVRLKNGLRF